MKDPFRDTTNTKGQIVRPSGTFRKDLVTLLVKHHVDAKTDKTNEEVADFILETLRILVPDEMGMRRLTGDRKVILPPEAMSNERELIRRLLDAIGSPNDSPVSYLQIDEKRQVAFAYAVAEGWKLTAAGWKAPARIAGFLGRFLRKAKPLLLRLKNSSP